MNLRVTYPIDRLKQEHWLPSLRQVQRLSESHFVECFSSVLDSRDILGVWRKTFRTNRLAAMVRWWRQSLGGTLVERLRMGGRLAAHSCPTQDAYSSGAKEWDPTATDFDFKIKIKSIKIKSNILGCFDPISFGPTNVIFHNTNNWHSGWRNRCDS